MRTNKKLLALTLIGQLMAAASATLSVTIMLMARDLRATFMVHDIRVQDFQFFGLELYHAEWSGVQHTFLNISSMWISGFFLFHSILWWSSIFWNSAARRCKSNNTMDR